MLFARLNNSISEFLGDYIRSFLHIIFSQVFIKGQFLFQSKRREIPENVQTIAQLCSFHMLARSHSKPVKLGFTST